MYIAYNLNSTLPIIGTPYIWGVGKTAKIAITRAKKEAKACGNEEYPKMFSTVKATPQLINQLKLETVPYKPEWQIRDGVAYLSSELRLAAQETFHAALKVDKDTLAQFNALGLHDKLTALYLKLRHIQNRIDES